MQIAVFKYPVFNMKKICVILPSR